MSQHTTREGIKMLPQILKNFNLYVDGKGYAGRIEELTLPKLTLKTEEFQGGGMSAPVEIDMGMEKLEMELTFAEYDQELFKLFGLTNGSEVAFTIRGAVQSTGTPDPVIVNVRGFFKELDFDTWKPAEKATLKCSVACTYYKLSIKGVELIEIDPINMVRNVNGADQLAVFREILQV
jgi:P2 family phage contractile tail tube protein